jgi:hypothetical protein
LSAVLLVTARANTTIHAAFAVLTF